MSSEMLAPVLTRTSMYLFSMSHLTIFHCPVVLIEPAYPMNIVRPFCWTISDQILAASPSLFPWKPVWLIASRSSETLFGPTSIAFSGYLRYLFAFLSLTALAASFCPTTRLSNRPGFKLSEPYGALALKNTIMLAIYGSGHKISQAELSTHGGDSRTP